MDTDAQQTEIERLKQDNERLRNILRAISQKAAGAQYESIFNLRTLLDRIAAAAKQAAAE